VQLGGHKQITRKNLDRFNLSQCETADGLILRSGFIQQQNRLPGFHLRPRIQQRTLMEALTGLVNTSSNSGSTSLAAVMVFSILPVSTTAVVNSERLMLDLKKLLTRKMAARNTAMPMMRSVFFLLVCVITSSEIGGIHCLVFCKGFCKG
jgi:hypothetical protein